MIKLIRHSYYSSPEYFIIVKISINIHSLILNNPREKKKLYQPVHLPIFLSKRLVTSPTVHA